ncbi:MAG: hypothetical protein M0015_19255 [Betaproteobacteria bacterium]|nr:hypothetical protein [Betaproteobacteria bacterium]
MNLVDRAKNILLQPKAEWPVIEREQTDAKALYQNYILILALIPAVAGLIGRAFLASHFGAPWAWPRRSARQSSATC